MFQFKHLNFQYNSYNINIQSSFDEENWTVDIVGETSAERIIVLIKKSDLADLILFLKSLPLNQNFPYFE